MHFLDNLLIGDILFFAAMPSRVGHKRGYLPTNVHALFKGQ